MSVGDPSPEIAALFISDDQFRQESGIAAGDPLLAEGGQRLGSALAAAAVGVAAGLTTAIVMVAALRWPAGLALAALIAGAISALLDLDEVAFIAALAALAGLVWFGIALAAAGGAAVALALSATVVTALLAYLGLRWRRNRRRRDGGYEVLGRLHQSIQRYNALIRALDVRDRLRRARGRDEPPMDEAVLRAIRTTRDNLVRALRVQRVLREGRDAVLDAEALRVDELIPVEALRIEETAEAYSELAGETLAVAAEVQQAYEELCAETEVKRPPKRRA